MPARTPRRNSTAVILEDIRAQNRAVIEAVQGLGIKVERDLANLRAELIERIERLESAVRQNSRDIQKNSEDIRNLQVGVSALQVELSAVQVELSAVQVELSAVKEAVGLKVDRASLVELELRVAALERRAGG